jgi:hypothetical protein
MLSFLLFRTLLHCLPQGMCAPSHLSNNPSTPKGITMNAMPANIHHDSRTDERFATEVEIICQIFGSTRTMRSVQGLIRNFSRRGLYIETDHPFKTGTILIVRMVGCQSSLSTTECREIPRSICLGEIKWQQNLGPEEAPHYGTGLRYLD